MADTDAAAEHPDQATVEYDGPAGGWGSLRGIAQNFRKGMGLADGARHAEAAEQAQRLHVRLLLLGQAGRLSRVRVLRERRQGHALGIDEPPLHPGFLRQAHRQRTAHLERLRPGAAGPTDPSHALRRRDRPLRPLRMGGSVSRRSDPATQVARSEIRHLLFVRPRQPRDVLPLRPVRAPVRQQQSARQLQHVPRDHVGRPEEGHRRRRRHRRLQRSQPIATRCSSSARTPARTARGFSTRCRMRPSAACRSSPSIPCGKKGWKSSSIRKIRRKC